jgi:hypothetical protein
MSDVDYTSLYKTCATLSEWIDDNAPPHYAFNPMAQDWARISKLAEEVGEAISAFIGATGQNPRKGFSNDMTDVYDEIVDVIITGVCALSHFTKDVHQTKAIVEQRLRYRIEKMKLVNE